MFFIGKITPTTQNQGVVVDGDAPRFITLSPDQRRKELVLSSTINCCSCIIILSLAICITTKLTTPFALAIQVSSRNVLIRQAIDTSFQCGQVPVYKKTHKVSIEPDLRNKVLANNRVTGLEANNSSSTSRTSVSINSLLSTTSTETTTTSSNNGNFRILYGLDATFGEWPWIVKIDVCKPDEECEQCTGSLLNDRWIITAGHCVKHEDKGVTYKATMAQYDLIVPDNYTFVVQIDKVIRHPAYQDLTNDLSLMRLAKPVEFNEFIQPVCLLDPTRDLLAYTSSLTCMNIGYGLIENMMQAVRLQKIMIRPLAAQECNSDKLDDVQLRTGTICIGPPEGNIGGSCHGDSGGPDVCYDPVKDQWILIGTVSYGPNDCDREKGSHWLTVSVDLSNYRTWIVETLQKEKD